MYNDNEYGIKIYVRDARVPGLIVTKIKCKTTRYIDPVSREIYTLVNVGSVIKYSLPFFYIITK